MNGNTDIKLSIKHASSIMGMILVAGIWLGVNVLNTKETVLGLKTEIKELKADVKSFNEKLSKIVTSVAVLAANKRSSGHD